MHIKNFVLNFGFIGFFSLAFCGEQIAFKPKVSENMTYLTTIHNISDSRINYESDSSILLHLKKSGLVFPVVSRDNQAITTRMETGKLINSNEIPFVTTVDSVFNSSIVNGEYQDNKAKLNIDTSMIFSGRFRDDSMIIDDFKSSLFAPEMVDAVKNSIVNMMKSVKFPDKSMSIGESFEQIVPLSIPVSATSVIQFNMRTLYRLSKIDSKSATFDILLSYEMFGGEANENLSMKGEGKGVMIYDRALNYIIRYDSESTMNFIVKQGALAVKSDSKTTSNMNLKIISKN